MAGPGRSGQAPHAGSAGDSPGPADPRAWLRLDQIEPTPDWPPTEQPITTLSDRGADRLQQALALLAEQRYTEASLQAEKALRTDPQSFQVHRALARMHMATGSTTRARLHARQAVERNPHDAVSRYLLGRLAMGAGDTQIALQEFRCALRALEGNSSPATAALVHFHLGEFLEAEGFHTAAAHQYDAYRAIVMDPSFDRSVSDELTTLVQLVGPGASVQRARVYEHLGDFAEAAGALDELVRSTDSDVDTRRRHAILLARAGDVERAKSIGRRLVGSGESGASLLEELHAIIDDPQGLVGELRWLANEHPANIELTIALADALVNDGQAGPAIDTLQLALESGHADAAAHWRLTDLLLDAANWRSALAVLSSAADRYPQADSHVRDRVERLAGEPDALGELLDAHDAADESGRQPSPAEDYVTGLLADRSGNPDLAHVLWRRSLSGAPEFIQARLELIEEALGAYRWDAALNLCLEAPEANANDARLKWMSGRAVEGLDDFDRAIAFYNESIRLNRTDTRPRHSLAELYLGIHRPALAQQQYQALVSVNSLDQTAREALIRLYLDIGERQAARRGLETLVRLVASPARIARCRARIELQRGPGVLERYRQTIESALDPANPDYRSIYEIAWSYLGEERYEEARDGFDRVLQLHPDHIDAAQRLTQAQAGLLDYEARISGLRSLLRRFPNRLSLWHVTMNALLDEQAYEEVVTSAQQILRRESLSDEDRQRFRSYLVFALQATDQADEILSLALEWHRRDPDNDGLRRTLISASLKADRIDDALDVARKEHLRHPANGMDRQVFMGAMLMAKRYGQASQFVLQWLEDDPDNELALLSLIGILLEADQYDDAVELAKANMGRARDPHSYQLALLDIYRKAKRYDEAEELLSKQLRSIDRRNDDEHELERHGRQLRLADLLISAQRYDRAQERLSGWIAESRKPALRFNFLTMLSICHADRGQSRQAIEALELAHGIDPRNAGACNDLGYMLADAGLRLEEAETLVRYAVARSPRNAAYLDSLGWVMYKKGDFEAADRWLQKATHTGEDVDPVVLDHLADTYWHLGRTEEAIEIWQEARDLTEDGETANVRTLRESLEMKLDVAGQGGVPPVAPSAKPTPQEAM